MPKDLGDPVGPGYATDQETAGSSLTAGDAVAIDQSSGDLEKLDSGNTDRDQFAGIVRDDAESGDDVVFTTEAPNGVVANVANGLSAGERAGASATAGQLASSDGDFTLARSDEDGSFDGHSLASNEAVVSY